jgi:serine/threonine protein kinase/TolB-like protein/tetratricopeptide (TPR) repeat protein
MNLSGLTDSRATQSISPNECPHCHAATRIVHGLCLGCLLQFGSAEENSEANELEAALDAIAVPDTHWRLGNYEILEEIGRGGMGVIYRARQRHSRRIVALKRVLSYHADSRDTLARFRREAEAAASLDHPNILPIYEVGESEEGVPFFSMKYASGGSLQEVGPALHNDPREIARLMAKVTRAVQYAHRQGILHRDLKPGNILLDSRDEPLVSDFGLAKWLDASSDLTRTLTIFGTPGYIAPEQAEGPAASLKPSADVYSLGAILFDLLAGRPPFLGEHALAVIRQAAEKPSPKLRSLVKTTDRDLETICARCLEREPAARYHSASDLAEDLERWLEGRPIVARPVLPPVQLWRWIRRNPALAGAAAIALLLGGLVAKVKVERRHLVRTVNADSLYKRSIAVLPFLDLDTGLANTKFAQSFSAIVQTKVSRLGAARIVPISNKESLSPGFGTPVDVRAISNGASARSVLCGTLRRVNQRLSASIRLVDAASGDTLLQRHLLMDDSASPEKWAGVVAPEISAALNGDNSVLLSPRDPALSSQTASEYLRAGEEFQKRRGKSDLDHALDSFQSAIGAAPSSALARSYFAMAAVTRFYYAQSSTELLATAERFGREAVRLNPSLPEAHRALSGLLYARGDLLGSREQAIEAIELAGLAEGPVVSVATITKITGRPDLSLRWHEIAKRIQEHPADYEFSIGDCWADLIDDERASVTYERVSALHPDLPEGWVGPCRLRMLQSDFEGARKIYRDNLAQFANFPFATQMAAEVEFFGRNWPEAEKLYGALAASDPTGGSDFYGLVTFQSALGRLRQLAGDSEAAEATLQRSLAIATQAFKAAPHNPDILYRLAAVESSLDKRESALKHLRAAFEAGRLDYRSLKLDPRFDAINGDPQFTRLCEAMATRVASLRAAAVSRRND